MERMAIGMGTEYPWEPPALPLTARSWAELARPSFILELALSVKGLVSLADVWVTILPERLMEVVSLVSFFLQQFSHTCFP